MTQLLFTVLIKSSLSTILCKFRAPVIPGDQLRLEIKLIKIKLTAVRLQGEAYVEDKLVAQALIMANIVDRI